MIADKQKEEIIYHVQQNYIRNIKRRGEQQLAQLVQRQSQKILISNKSQSFHDPLIHTNLFDQYIRQRRIKRDLSESCHQQLNSSIKQFQLKKILIGKPHNNNSPNIGLSQFKFVQKAQFMMTNNLKNLNINRRRSQHSPSFPNIQQKSLNEKPQKNEVFSNHKDHDVMQPRESISRIKINGWQIDTEEEFLF